MNVSEEQLKVLRNSYKILFDALELAQKKGLIGNFAVCTNLSRCMEEITNYISFYTGSEKESIVEVKPANMLSAYRYICRFLNMVNRMNKNPYTIKNAGEIYEACDRLDQVHLNLYPELVRPKRVQTVEENLKTDSVTIERIPNDDDNVVI